MPTPPNLERIEKYSHGVAYIFVSVFNLSLFLLFTKLGTENTPFFLLTFLRFLVPLLLILPILHYRDLFKTFSLFKDSQHHLSRGFCVLVMQYAVFYYLTKGSLLNLTALLNLSPIFIALAERILFKHHIPKSVAISLAISFVGVLCVLQPDKDLFSWLSLLGLLAAMAQAGSQVLYGLNIKREPQAISLFYLFFIGSIASFCIFIISDLFLNQKLFTDMHLFFANWTSPIYLIGLSIFTLVNQLFRGMAYKHGRPSSFAPFLYFTVFFSALFDWFIFHASFDLLSLVGTLLILLGGLLQIFLHRVVRLK